MTRRFNRRRFITLGLIGLPVAVIADGGWIEPGWLKVADHPRRGLVVACPHAVDPEHALWWLLTATHVLSVVPLTSTWLARIYTP